MQLMPATARHYGADPHDTAQNIDAGTRFLRELLLKYEHHPDQLALALAAYNAGPGAVDHFGGVPPYKETQTYVRKAIHLYKTATK
jgi:soluble lytic murein transglycosylase-like protein